MNLSIPLFFLVFLFSSFVFIVYLLSLASKRFREYAPPVSIIIPTYNEEKNIEECIKSIADCNYKNIQIICVDDGSQDRTTEVIKSFKVKLIRLKHKGKANALNAALKHAEHDFVLVLDADVRLTKEFIKNMLSPFSDEKVGATAGVCMIDKPRSIIGKFQEVEYLYINLVRSSFSNVFGNGIWFFGAAACFRKNLVRNFLSILTEDMEMSLRIAGKGYKVLTVEDAVYYTKAVSLKGLIRQRMRWFFGGLQCVWMHRRLFNRSIELAYLFSNQVFWAFYSLVIIPIIIYQVNYWMPSVPAEIFWYLFRWFSLFGPFYVLYMLPVWGLSFLNIFGVTAGIMTSALLLLSMHRFRQKITLTRLMIIVFYFPYTLLMNLIFVMAMIKYTVSKKNFV
jgi:cellulose synthase/poly-beta-1,6-N-acetylglucosamine synthase-like glycosyltransferase